MIRNIFYSDRQLPPGHDPGADSGEAPNGRQRGSLPLDILVECRGHLRPRRDKPQRRENPRLSASRPMIWDPLLAGWLGPAGHSRLGVHGAPGGLRPQRSRRSRRRRCARARRDDVTSGEGRRGRSRHGGHGGHGPTQSLRRRWARADSAGVTTRREGSRRSLPARRSRGARLPWPPCGAARTGPS
jgi:hypothetical protein